MEIVGHKNEAELRDQIFELLQKSGIFCWKDRQLARKPGQNMKTSVGVSDILGIYRSKFLAIEVKMPRGVVSPEQQKFLEGIAHHGGIAIVARSLSDVMLRLGIGEC